MIISIPILLLFDEAPSINNCTLLLSSSAFCCCKFNMASLLLFNNVPLCSINYSVYHAYKFTIVSILTNRAAEHFILMILSTFYINVLRVYMYLYIYICLTLDLCFDFMSICVHCAKILSEVFHSQHFFQWQQKQYEEQEQFEEQSG